MEIYVYIFLVNTPAFYNNATNYSNQNTRKAFETLNCINKFFVELNPFEK